MKFLLISFGSALLFFLFFYFYPAEIFESKVSGNGTEAVVELSLKSILHKENLPEGLNPQNIESIRPTVAGFMIMIICMIALPVMIAYRFTLKKKVDDSSQE